MGEADCVETAIACDFALIRDFPFLGGLADSGRASVIIRWSQSGRTMVAAAVDRRCNASYGRETPALRPRALDTFNRIPGRFFCGFNI